MSDIRTVDLRTLDPDTYKEQFKTFLKGKTVFRDYNLEDSNIDMLLTILGHNTYQNSFYKNMIFSEAILSKAQLRSSVISKANELGYLPQSRKSSVALVDININASLINTLELPKGTQFSGRVGINSYSFTTDKSYIAKSPIGQFRFKNIQLYEGSYFSDTYIVDSSLTNQEFVISNPNVDISSLSVLVVENNGNLVTEFIRKTNTFELSAQDNIFFVEGYMDNKYRIIFGDNVLGRTPDSKATVIITFRVCTGTENANFVDTFSLDEDIVSQQNGQLNSIDVICTNPSFGGGDRESTEQIKYNAPRFYASQESAVSCQDYKSLLLNRFSAYINDISVYGGEKAHPKQYGKTIIAIKPKYNTITPQFIKDDIYAFLRDYNVGSVIPEMIDADAFYLKVNTTVEYSSPSTTLFPTDIEKAAILAIKNYSSTKLERFDGDFRFSKFAAAIDSADPSITSNDTDIRLVKRIVPKINSDQKFSINFGNALEIDTDPVVNTSTFTWISDIEAHTSDCFISDDSTGYLNVYTINSQGNKVLVEKKIGTVNYDGLMYINTLRILDYYGTYLEIVVKTKNKNVIMTGGNILYIDPNDITLNVQSTIE